MKKTSGLLAIAMLMAAVSIPALADDDTAGDVAVTPDMHNTFECTVRGSRLYRGYGEVRWRARERAMDKCQNDPQNWHNGVPDHSVCLFQGCVWLGD